MLFHTLAMLEPERLHEWIATSPASWWAEGPKKDKVYTKFSDVAGLILNHIFKADASVFKDLVERHPHLLESNSSCRFFVSDWCEHLAKEGLEQLEPFQSLLLSQPMSWYVTKPERIHYLNSEIPIERLTETRGYMVAAAVADNGVFHSKLKDEFPGIEGYVAMLHSMLRTTKDKKAQLNHWMKENVPLESTWKLDIAAFELT